MEVRHLGNTDFKVIINCFLSAFENYFVKMPTDHNYYKQRWEAAGVKYDWSYGMFDGYKLVGFIIHAIDKRHGHLTAYNTGTGVIPEYRRRRIVKSIYEYSIPRLLNIGVTKFQLEVIIENHKAIKAYESIGFKKCRTLKCYSGELLETDENFVLKNVDIQDLDWNSISNQEYYSWDFHTNSLKKGNSKFYILYNNDEPESFFSMNPKNCIINQFEVLKNVNDPMAWKLLFAGIASKYQKVRTINVDSRLKTKIEILEELGFNNTINQYEMELFV